MTQWFTNDWNIDVWITRLVRIWVISGKFYNTLIEPPEEVEVLERLIQKSEDKHEIVKRRLKNWKAFLPKLENEYESKIITILAEKKAEDVTDAISDAIEGATN